MPAPVDRPIFIVGCPRSGTGLLHQLVRLHPHIAWITPLTNWICGHDWQDALGVSPVRWAGRALAACPRALRPQFLRGPYDGSLSGDGLPETAEGHSIWERHLPSDHHVATEDDVTPEIRAYLHRVFHWHVRYADASRFVCKTPRNLLRMRYFNEIFPDARFVHLVRDGRAVAASILKRRLEDEGDPNAWWGIRPPGWEEQRSRPPIEQCAWVWKACLHYADRMRDTYVPADRIHTVRYESLTREPETTLTTLFAELDCSPTAYDLPASLRNQIRPPHDRWQTRLSERQLDRLRMLDDLLQEQGYSPVHAAA